ncbi:MAG TPA: hypothetical protein VD997_09125 [Phycisphaerales bacterium]|nr:hypothetical protein [Phycisphaerales bacterium]
MPPIPAPTPVIDMDVAPTDYDALADLFLADEPLARPAAIGPRLKLASDEAEAKLDKKPEPTKSSNGTTDSSSRAPGVVIEGVLAGHLPVLASAWITQYARHLADTDDQPVALLRLVSGQAVLDLILPTGHKIPADISTAPGEKLTAVLARMAARFRRWVIRVDEPSESDFFQQPHLAGIAILTGGDDPAIVSTFQAIKGLSHDLTDTAPAVHLVIMGATDARAELAESRLRRAASQFLRRDLPAATRIPRISSSLAVQLYRAPTTTTIAEVIAALRAAPAAPKPLPEAGVGVGSSDARPATPINKQPVVIPTIQPAPASIAPAQVPHSSTPPLLHSTSPTPHTASRVGPLAVVSDPLLSQLHLTPLTITCPYAPSIRMAADAQGRLHLLALDDIDPSDGAARLLTAASWANDHAPLLVAAAPALKSAADPALHVLTNDAKLVRPLLDTGLRLHAITRVEVGGQSITAVIALN